MPTREKANAAFEIIVSSSFLLEGCGFQESGECLESVTSSTRAPSEESTALQMKKRGDNYVGCRAIPLPTTTAQRSEGCCMECSCSAGQETGNIVSSIPCHVCWKHCVIPVIMFLHKERTLFCRCVQACLQDC
jgi:hypothetical protein